MPTSFRDPSGQALVTRERVLRLVNRRGESDLLAFLDSGVGKNLVKARLVVGTERVSEADATCLLQSPSALWSGEPEANSLFEHERVPFRSYPFEWAPEMLHAAGVLTLDIAEDCLKEGFGLKDATPYNVLFRSSRPIFVDLLSFEKRNPGDPIWLASAQFTRNFTLPLLLNQRMGLPPSQVFATRRDGIQPREVYGFLGGVRKLLPPYLSLVTIPVWLSSFENEKLYRLRPDQNPERARFILTRLFRSLRRQLASFSPRQSESEWSVYMGKNCSYTEEQFAVKARFVDSSLDHCQPAALLDLGCNDGFFSILAAKKGARVVAIDGDSIVVGHLWKKAYAQDLDILPLVADICRPSAALGWRNSECPALLDRLRGNFDTVLMLALVHHLLVTERIPLPEVVDLACELCTRHAIIEYIGPGDPMFQRLTRGRDALHESFNQAVFERAWNSRFETLKTCQLPGSSRTLYLLRRRA